VREDRARLETGERLTNRRTTAERVVPASARTILATASHEIRARVHTPSSGERLVHMLVHMHLHLMNLLP
jgi:hypothetical protein